MPVVYSIGLGMLLWLVLLFPIYPEDSSEDRGSHGGHQASVENHAPDNEIRSESDNTGSLFALSTPDRQQGGHGVARPLSIAVTPAVTAPPVITAPQAIIVEATALHSPVVFPAATQRVTVTDTTPPTIMIRRSAITVEALAAQNVVNLGLVLATDLVSGAIIPTNNAPATFPLGLTTVIWSATDAAGNRATASQAVTVQDTTPPTLTLPPAVSGVLQNGYSTVALSLGQATARDTFPPITLTNNAPVTFPLGTTIVTWTATDANGNRSNGTQLITVSANATVANLPPDPGPAGKLTLAGIDSDNDGVRDDVQRWIALNYPNSQKTRAALGQLSQDYQKFILDSANVMLIYEDARLMDRTQSCLIYVSNNPTARIGLKSQMLNTYARSKAFMQADSHLSGRMYRGLPYSQWKLGCKFNPATMPN